MWSIKLYFYSHHLYCYFMKYFLPISALKAAFSCSWKTIFLEFWNSYSLKQSHKKSKDSLEGSVDRLLLVARFELPKIPVPSLPQHISDVNIECPGKLESSKQLYFLHVTRLLEHWYILILLFWYWYVFNWWCLV